MGGQGRINVRVKEEIAVWVKESGKVWKKDKSWKF